MPSAAVDRSPDDPSVSAQQSSTLVETVNINLEDFSETFLTCGTCLCSYDGRERKPKLLSCSHTVCQHCLQRIAALPQAQDTGSIRCPICRETHQIPRAGVASLPPSFLVNQLLDLMMRQRKDVVPKCTNHPQEELFFCETCDTVFCSVCNDSQGCSPCHNHTIVPFSVAIKRMSEILLYKANQCVRNLNRAHENVHREMTQLDVNVDRILDEVNASFQDLAQLLDLRRRELVDSTRRTRDEKRKVLQEQLGIIQSEKAKVEQQCTGLHQQVEVRNITRRISDLNDKLDHTLHLVEPRENAFLRYDSSTEQVLSGIQAALAHFGQLSVSRTFPPLCTAALNGVACVHLLNHVTVHTIDYNGQPRTNGGDPVEAQLQSVVDKLSDSKQSLVGVHVQDNQDGTYDLAFRPLCSGEYKMSMSIFGRPIRSSPLHITVSQHHSPVWQFGCVGASSALCQLNQPVKVCTTLDNSIYILDTGNCRVLSVDSSGNNPRVVTGQSALDRSTVSLALLPPSLSQGSTPTSADCTLLTLNWRTKIISEWSISLGEQLRSIRFSEFQEPIDMAVDATGRIVVADNGAKKVFVFDQNAQPLFSFPVLVSTALKANGSPLSCALISPPSSPQRSHTLGGRPQTTLSARTSASAQSITAVAIGLNEDILVARGQHVQLFDNTGRWVRQINVLDTSQGCSNGVKGVPQVLIGGVAVDRPSGTVLATVTEGQRTYVSVSQYKGQLSFTLDSIGAKLKRPSGVCVTAEKTHCLVADLGNNALKKYAFR